MSNSHLRFTRLTRSDNLTLDDVIARLKGNSAIDGIAQFGSQIATHRSLVSDFDLLIVVASPPVSIFQCLTHIEHRMADIALVSTLNFDQLYPAAAYWVNGRGYIEIGDDDMQASMARRANRNPRPGPLQESQNDHPRH